jgi:hypothetical protein
MISAGGFGPVAGERFLKSFAAEIFPLLENREKWGTQDSAADDCC